MTQFVPGPGTTPTPPQKPLQSDQSSTPVHQLKGRSITQTLSSAVKKVALITAKVVVGLIICMPAGIALAIASNRKISPQDKLGGMADKVATKIRSFFANDFFKISIGQKAFPFTQEQKAADKLRKKIHDFISSHPQLTDEQKDSLQELFKSFQGLNFSLSLSDLKGNRYKMRPSLGTEIINTLNLSSGLNLLSKDITENVAKKGINAFLEQNPYAAAPDSKMLQSLVNFCILADSCKEITGFYDYFLGEISSLLEKDDQLSSQVFDENILINQLTQSGLISHDSLLIQDLKNKKQFINEKKESLISFKAAIDQSHSNFKTLHRSFFTSDLDYTSFDKIKEAFINLYQRPDLELFFQSLNQCLSQCNELLQNLLIHDLISESPTLLGLEQFPLMTDIKAIFPYQMIKKHPQLFAQKFASFVKYKLQLMQEFALNGHTLNNENNPDLEKKLNDEILAIIQQGTSNLEQMEFIHRQIKPKLDKLNAMISDAALEIKLKEEILDLLIQAMSNPAQNESFFQQIIEKLENLNYLYEKPLTLKEVKLLLGFHLNPFSRTQIDQLCQGLKLIDEKAWAQNYQFCEKAITMKAHDNLSEDELEVEKLELIGTISDLVLEIVKNPEKKDENTQQLIIALKELRSKADIDDYLLARLLGVITQAPFSQDEMDQIKNDSTPLAE